MSRFANQTGPSNPPFNAVDPSGSSPDQSIATIGQATQGNLQRRHETNMANAQMQQQAQQAFYQRQHESRMAARNARVDLMRGEIERRNQDYWRERADRLARDQMRADRELRAADRANALEDRAMDLENTRRLGEINSRVAGDFQARRTQLETERDEAQRGQLTLSTLRSISNGVMTPEFSQAMNDYATTQFLELDMLNQAIDDVGAAVSTDLTRLFQTGDGLTNRLNLLEIERDPEALGAFTDRIIAMASGGDGQVPSTITRNRVGMVLRNMIEAARTRGSDNQGANELIKSAAYIMQDLARTEGIDPDMLAVAFYHMGEIGERIGAPTEAAAVAQGVEVAEQQGTPYDAVLQRLENSPDSMAQFLREAGRLFMVTDTHGKEILRNPGEVRRHARALGDQVDALLTAITGSPANRERYLAQARLTETGYQADPQLVEAVAQMFAESQGREVTESDLMQQAEAFANYMTTAMMGNMQQSLDTLVAGPGGADIGYGGDFPAWLEQAFGTEGDEAGYAELVRSLGQDIEALGTEQTDAAASAQRDRQREYAGEIQARADRVRGSSKGK